MIHHPDRAVIVAAGQHLAIGAERHGIDGPGAVLSGGPSTWGCAGSATFHSRMVPSFSPLARVWPSGLNVIE